MIHRLVGLLRKVATLPGAGSRGSAGAASAAVAALSCAMEAVRRQELARRLEREALTPEEAERMDRLSRDLVERLLLEPGRRLSLLAVAGADPAELVDAVRLMGPAGDGPRPCPLRR